MVLKSLSPFFEKTDTVTLNNCDREAIHLSGKIQSLGALLVIAPDTFQIIGASENAAQFLGCNGENLLDVPLQQIDATLADEVAKVLDSGQVLHQILEYGLSYADMSYDCIAHVHAGNLIVEFVPNTTTSAKEARTAMRKCSAACSRVLQSDSFELAQQTAVDAVREITGFSRAKIYRFQSDWSGEVVAESNDGVLPSYLGLCFPTTDIPAQAREIMKIVPYRMNASTSDETISILSKNLDVEALDLTWSLLRSISTMHTQYLRNIGVGAGFTSALIDQGELWGFFSTQNHEAAVLPFDVWGLVKDIGTALMLRYAQEQRVEVADSITRLRVIESKFASQLRLGGDVEDVISDLVPELQRFLGADGFAFQFGSRLHLSGRTPPAAFIAALTKWASNNADIDETLFQTNALHRLWPEAAAHMDTACGVLIQPMVTHRVCQLIWFRGPLSRTVKWAGRPTDVAAKETQDVLTPRNSFDTWVQEHNDQSAPWKKDELQCAREIFSEFLDIVTAQLLLKQENSELREFAARAAHDLKAPLRGIKHALDWMSEDDFEPDSVREKHAIAKRSSARVTALADSILELAVVESLPLKVKPVKLDQVVGDVKDLLFMQLQEHGATITHTPLPILNCDQSTVLRIFMNLTLNALTFRKPDVPPVIHVTSTVLGNGETQLSFSDNGIGIAQKFADRVFRPLVRLHSKDQIEGTGLGLAICDRIMDRHGGIIRLDTTYSEGARFQIIFPKTAKVVT